MQNSEEHRKLAAIMFTDMVGYSALTQRDEALALALLRAQQQLVRPIFARYSGREVKSTGDGFLVEFTSALHAVRCAVDIQKAMMERNASETPERQILLRIGLHLGDVEVRDGDVFGDGVNIAARAEPLAEAGGVCITGPVFDQIHNKIDVPLVKLDRPKLKNIHVPIDIYRLVLPWTTEAQPRRRRAGWRFGTRGAALAASGVGAAALLLWWMAARAPQVPPAPLADTASLPTAQSVAVLPFANMSPDASDEYLSDGMSEELIAELSKIHGLQVAARTSSFVFKGKNQDIGTIGRQLNVGTVLEGSVRRSGHRVRIGAQLIDVRNGYHLWSDTYEDDLADLFGMQSKVAQHVAESLKIKLGVGDMQRLDKAATKSSEAHELYLKGEYYTARFTRKALEKGKEAFQQAIDLDPNYAPAYLGLAYYYGVAIPDYVMPPRDAMPKAAAAARKALEIDPEIAAAHAYLGWVRYTYDWDWAAAEAEFRRAVEQAPDAAVGHELYGAFLVRMGRWDEGIAAGRRAVELDPLSPDTNTFLGESLLTRDVPGAIAQLQRTIEMEPQYWYARTALARGYVRAGRVDEGIAEAHAALQIENEAEGNAVLGWALAHAGRRDEALAIADALVARSQQQYVSPYFVAMVYAGLGDADLAFEWLDRAYAERSALLVWESGSGDLESLYADPRFAALMTKMGLPH